MIGSDSSFLADMNQRGTSNRSKAGRVAIRVGREGVDRLGSMLVRVDVWVVRVGVILERRLEHVRRSSGRHPLHSRGRLGVGVHRGSHRLAWVHRARSLWVVSIGRLVAFLSVRSRLAAFLCVLTSKSTRRTVLAAGARAVALHPTY